MRRGRGGRGSECERRSEVKQGEAGGSGGGGDSPLLLEKAPGADELLCFPVVSRDGNFRRGRSVP